MSAFIHSYCTISRLNTFGTGILATMNENRGEVIVHPDYSKVIVPDLIRRMSPMIRTGVGAALMAKGETEISGIVVGTGLGCMENTGKFLDQFVSRSEGILAPTAFIQSTHNTVAGQIALTLGNTCYNSTYTQRGVSFENALIDAMMLCNETKANILVGGIDEFTPLMAQLAQKATLDSKLFGEGASFLVLSYQADGARSKVSACYNFSGGIDSLAKEVMSFLDHTGLIKPDLILFGDSGVTSSRLLDLLADIKTVNYSDLCGNYMSNSAFALQMACEIIEGKGAATANRILIVNNFNNCDFGLVYVEKP